MDNKLDEQVLCVASEAFEQSVQNTGAIFDDFFCASTGEAESPADMILRDFDAFYRCRLFGGFPSFTTQSVIKFVPRSVCETDPTYRQIIPYTLLSYDEKYNGDWELLSYWRGKESTEKRLVGNCSIGIGGHINIEDTKNLREEHGIYDVLRCCRNREIQEEVDLDWQTLVLPENECRFVGIINDTSNDVGKVHIGIVYEHFLTSKDIKPKEDALKTFEFMTVANQKVNYTYMEPWSQIVYRYLEKEEKQRRFFLGEDTGEDL